VPKYQGRGELLNLKERCAQLMKPWADLKNQATRLKNKIEATIQVPTEKKQVYADRFDKLGLKYTELAKYKDEYDIEGLENNQIPLARYSDKIKEYGKELLNRYAPKEEIKKSPAKLPQSTPLNE
jgi:hypothetical protein